MLAYSKRMETKIIRKIMQTTHRIALDKGTTAAELMKTLLGRVNPDAKITKLSAFDSFNSGCIEFVEENEMVEEE